MQWPWIEAKIDNHSITNINELKVYRSGSYCQSAMRSKNSFAYKLLKGKSNSYKIRFSTINTPLIVLGLSQTIIPYAEYTNV